MKKSTRNRAKGFGKQAKGKAKQMAGKVVRSKRLSYEGRAEAAAGKARRKYGQMQDEMEETEA